MTWRVGIDTGGTFTDAVAYNDRKRIWVARKIWSSRGDPGGSLRNALKALEVPIEEISALVYGTTVVTNALIEDNLARVALVCTKGFRDVLHIARQQRDIVFSVRAIHRDPPIVPRDLSLELDERCEADGTISKPVCLEEVQALVETLKGQADVVAVSLLHSYLNPENERAFADIAGNQLPYVMTSVEVSPEAREYERTLSTALNAALLPLMTDFIGSVRKSGVSAERLHLFHSAGGMVSLRTAARLPLSLVMSGPAAGVEAASRVADSLDIGSCISLDMGGTTTDCSLILDGLPEMQMDGRIGQYRVRQPIIAVGSVGAGGGSIVRMTDHGLSVGPDSAGSEPGPACYARGGSEPTIADALAVLGYFGSNAGSRRRLAIDVELARQAFAPLAERLRLSVEEAALGALRVACSIMARAIKRITMGRGIDARNCTLIAFGGVGPMVACVLADELGLTNVVVPQHSSALSALGCLTTQPSFTRQRTVRFSCRGFDQQAFRDAVTSLGQEVLDELVGADADVDDATTTFQALMRYSGQSYDIDVPISADLSREELGTCFAERHKAVYGYELGSDWDCVAIRARAFRPTEPVVFSNAEDDWTDLDQSGTAYFQNVGWQKVAQVSRGSLASSPTSGPAIVVDEFSTTMLPTHWYASESGSGHVTIFREK